VTDHKGHNIGDNIATTAGQVFHRRAMILKKKIDASLGEAQLFSEELSEIED
jgi:hypothetical protein